MPTISNAGPSPPRVWNTFPIALRPGHSRRASVSFTTATRGESRRSAAVKPRPSTIGTPIVVKYSGETVVTSTVSP